MTAPGFSEVIMKIDMLQFIADPRSAVPRDNRAVTIGSIEC